MTNLRKAPPTTTTPAVGGIPPVGTMNAVPGYRPELWGGFYPTAPYAALRWFIDAEGVPQAWPDNYRDYKLDFGQLLQTPPISGAEITRLVNLNLRGQFDPAAPYAYFTARYNVWNAGPSLPYPNPAPEVIRAPQVNAWDAGALTTDAYANRATFTFTTDIGTVAAVGLAQPGRDVADPNALDFAFIFRSYKPVAVLELGVETALTGITVTPSTTFAVSYIDGVVNYLVNGTSARTITTTPPAGNTIWYGAAALYSARSNVIGTSIAGASKGACVLPALRTGQRGAQLSLKLPRVAGGYTYVAQNMVLPRMLVAARGLGYTGMRVPKLALQGGSGYAQGSLSLRPLTAAGYAGRPLIYGMLGILPRVGAVGVGTSGTVGHGNMTLRALKLRGGRLQAEARLSVPKLRGLGVQEDRLTAYVSGAPLLAAPVISTTFLTVRVNSAGTITSVGSVKAVRNASMTSNATIANTLTPRMVMSAIMKSALLGSSFAPLFDGGDGGVGGSVTGDRGPETWVVNYDTGASSSYENFSFNSYGSVNGQLYGLGTDGLYLLEGDSDNGAPIHASVNFGKSNFGTAMLKRMESAYVGVSSTGTMFLKITLDGGASYIYSARRDSADMAVQRFDVGRGIRASYLAFELFNNAGGDFELDTVSFVAAELTRKV